MSTKKQTEDVYALLLLTPLTCAEAMKLGVGHLPRRIADLKEYGVLLREELVTGHVSRLGRPTHFKRWSLDPASPVPDFTKPPVKQPTRMELERKRLLKEKDKAVFEAYRDAALIVARASSVTDAFASIKPKLVAARAAAST